MGEIVTLFIALGLGAIIGLERKINDQTAGIHTHALVSLGSALFILLGLKLAAPAEMSRVASQVVMGVGFLGAAVIMRDGVRVRGLNTAVTVWCSSAIGAIAGAGLYALACEGAVAIVSANFILHMIEHKAGWFNTPTALPDSDKNNPNK